MDENKTKGLTNLKPDEKITRETYVSLARMYSSQLTTISCLNYIYELHIKSGMNTK